jgi:hypothetical protein
MFSPNTTTTITTTTAAAAVNNNHLQHIYNYKQQNFSDDSRMLSSVLPEITCSVPKYRITKAMFV